MAVNVVLNGVSYSIPDPGDTAWGQGLTDYLVAQASGLLQKAGGTFTLTAEVDFGATYGLKSTYFKSRAASPATAGQVRLGNTESISWRNAANSANLALSVNSSNELTFNGSAIQPAGNYITALTGDVTATGPGSVVATIAAGAIDNAKVSNSAAIAYSKLALTGSIVNADISASAAIAYSKLALTGSIVNSDISASAAIAYSKLALTGSIVDADVAAGAAIAFSKLAALTSANILVGSGSNVATAVPVTGDVSLSNTGVTAYSGTVPLNKGGTGQTTKAAAFDALSPMTTSGDIIYGGASGTGTRLPKGSDGQVLTLASGLPSWANVGAAVAPTVQSFTSTGSTTGWLFTVTSANATAGATYTNNGNTYTVLGTIAGATRLFCSQVSAPQSSGTLTKASGTGDSTITFSAATALATYTRPTGPTPLYIRVRMVGGGGGGGGGGAGTDGGDGGDTTFSSTPLVAGGGKKGQTNGGGFGAGGTNSFSAGPAIVASMGGTSGIQAGRADPATATSSAAGGAGYFGGGGAGGAPAVNSGSGGAGGTFVGPAAGGTGWAGSGGGAGGYIEAIITSPAASYTYSIGAAGTAGNGAGSGGGNGNAGAAGYIVIEEYYQ